MERNVTRRGAIAATAAAGLTASCNSAGKPKDFTANSEMRTGVFKLGIASGDPVSYTHLTLPTIYSV